MQSLGKNKQNGWLKMFQKKESIGKFLIYDWMVSMATKRNFKELFTGKIKVKINFFFFWVTIYIWHYTRHLTCLILFFQFCQVGMYSLQMRLENFARDENGKGKDSKTGLLDSEAQD